MEKYVLCFLCIILWQGASAISYYYMDLYCGETINVGAHHQIRLKLTSSSAYDPNMHCEVTLKTDWSRRMMFFFKAMNIEQSDNCQDDFLEIDDGSSRSDPYITGGRQCGLSKPGGVYRTSGRYMTLYFESDTSVEYSGFDMIITSYHTGFCNSWEYDCDNGRCIDNSLTCSGYNPCGDYSDCDTITVSVGGIAGIVIGGIVFTIIVIIAVVVCRRRRALYVQQSPAVATVTTSYGYNQPVPTQYASPPPFQGSAVTTSYPQY